ncbi:MAG: glycosyltransferase [Acidobacteria bacterium]|nr:glycosyltransferase [Acidobacteriota bacterium]
MTYGAARPLVSVILPTCNRQAFLREALDSVRGQSYPHREIIVVDDGSIDGTADMVSRHFPDVRYAWQENRGPSAARNRGIAMAGGEWLAFLDSDDLWQPKKLERQLAVLAGKPEYAACYTDEIWIRRGVRVNPRQIHRKYSGWIFPHTLPLCIISPSSILLHRHLVEEVGLFDEAQPVCEDYDLWIRLTARYPVYFLEEQLIVKRGGHADQLSTRTWGNDIYRVRALQKVLDDETGWFTPTQKAMAYPHLAKKCRVLVLGFRKHGKEDEARHYEELISRYDRFTTAPPAVAKAAETDGP